MTEAASGCCAARQGPWFRPRITPTLNRNYPKDHVIWASNEELIIQVYSAETEKRRQSERGSVLVSWFPHVQISAKLHGLWGSLFPEVCAMVT